MSDPMYIIEDNTYIAIGIILTFFVNIFFVLVSYIVDGTYKTHENDVAWCEFYRIEQLFNCVFMIFNVAIATVNLGKIKLDKSKIDILLIGALLFLIIRMIALFIHLIVYSVLETDVCNNQGLTLSFLLTFAITITIQIYQGLCSPKPRNTNYVEI